jgi:hypothetical protein
MSWQRADDRFAKVLYLEMREARWWLLGLFAALMLAGAAAPVALSLQPRPAVLLEAEQALWRVVDRDRVFLESHIAVARALRGVRAPAMDSGPHWIKAAAHARTSAELDRVIAGLTADREHDRSGPELAELLCAYGKNGAPNVRNAVTGAGFYCTWSGQGSYS